MKLSFDRKLISMLFIAVQAVLYLSFLTIDIIGGSVGLSSGIKFTVIILCFCYVLICKESDSKSFLYISQAALFFTVISDLFILLLNQYFYGVLTFVIVQQLYGLRLDLTAESSKENKKESNINNKKESNIEKRILRIFTIRFSIQAVVTILLCLILRTFGVVLQGLLIITAFYFISIVTNVIRAVIGAVRGRKAKGISYGSLLFAIGMVLFLFCDINVGLFNMAYFIILTKTQYHLLYSISSILMWAFYAPAQVLIAMSIEGYTRSNS